MTRYLVTGGCGFIGSHLVDRLIEDGHDVAVLDDMSTGRAENLHPKVQLTVGDVRDRSTVCDLMTGAAGCFHLAAVASVERSNEDWAQTHTVNLTGTINVMDAARGKDRVRPVPVVYASSAAVYGNSTDLPLGENSATRPLTAYGADKLACELHARVGWLVHGVPVTGLRLFNVYGSRQDPKSPYSGVISRFIDCAQAGEPLPVIGDGEQSRDFIHVADVVRFFIAAMDTSQSGERVFNVCTGQPTTVNQLAEKIAVATGRVLSVQTLPPRAGDIKTSQGSPGKAAHELGATAGISLDDGLRLTLDATTADG